MTGALTRSTAAAMAQAPGAKATDAQVKLSGAQFWKQALRKQCTTPPNFFQMSIAVASGDQAVTSSSRGAGGVSVAISVSQTKQRPSLKRKNVKTTPRKPAKGQ